MRVIEQIKPEKIIFLDIETVPQAQSFEYLDNDTQKLWAEKSNLYNPNNLPPNETYERAGIFAEFGKIVCISIGALFKEENTGELKMKVRSFYNEDEKELLIEFIAQINKFNGNDWRIMGHNIREFDLPYICRRILVNGLTIPKGLDVSDLKPWEITHVDTLQLWKFGDFKHYISLKLLAHCLGVPSPKDDIDGSQVRIVFYEEKDLERIKVYCEKDIVTVVQVYLRMRNMPILGKEAIVN